MIRVAGLALMAAVTIAAAAPALAQQATPAPPETLRLTPEEKADILSHQTEASVDAARAGLTGSGDGRAIHGEMGAMIGTRGTRAVYGTAAIPLGEHAGAIVSFEDSRYGPRH